MVIAIPIDRNMIVEMLGQHYRLHQKWMMDLRYSIRSDLQPPLLRTDNFEFFRHQKDLPIDTLANDRDNSTVRSRIAFSLMSYLHLFLSCDHLVTAHTCNVLGPTVDSCTVQRFRLERL